MEQVSEHLAKSDDPITAKFDDSESMQRVIQQAITEAVSKGQRLGVLPLTDDSTPAKKS